MILVRHGAYDHANGGKLTDRGRKQVESLAGLLVTKRFTGPGISLLSSTSPRAQETAEILSVRLAIGEFEGHECLFPKDMELTHEEIRATLELIARRVDSCDTIVISTHLEFVEDFPEILGKFHRLPIQKGGLPDYGSATLIDMETGQKEYVRPKF